jgi:hypothetical protein
MREFPDGGQRIREFDEQKRIEKEAKATIRVSKKVMLMMRKLSR